MHTVYELVLGNIESGHTGPVAGHSEFVAGHTWLVAGHTGL